MTNHTISAGNAFATFFSENLYNVDGFFGDVP